MERSKVKEVFKHLPKKVPKKEPDKRLYNTLRKFQHNQILEHAYTEAVELAKAGKFTEALKAANRGIIPN